MLNERTSVSPNFGLRPYDHIWDMYYDEFDDEPMVRCEYPDGCKINCDGDYVEYDSPIITKTYPASFEYVERIRKIMDDEIPEADVVQVVRCRKCVYAVLNELYKDKYICDIDSGMHSGDFYCANGKRKL